MEVHEILDREDEFDETSSVSSLSTNEVRSVYELSPTVHGEPIRDVDEIGFYKN